MLVPRITLVLAGLILASSVAVAQENGTADRARQEPASHPIHLAVATFAAASVADGTTTFHLLTAHENYFREVNPLLRPLSKHPVALVSAKAGLAIAGTYLLVTHHKRHPRLTFWIGVGGAIAYSAAAVHNWRLNP